MSSGDLSTFSVSAEPVQRGGSKDSDLCVVKLGGSLVDLPVLAERLQELRWQLSEFRLLIIPGGGAAANTIRQVDQACQLTDSAAHWMAIDAMSFNADLVARTILSSRSVRTRGEAEDRWRAGGMPMLNPAAWLRAEGLDVAREMPESWSVSSDSIAALIARFWNARVLVLAKSCEPSGQDLLSLSAAEQVDSHLTSIHSLPRLVWVNLRSDTLRLTVIKRTNSD